jgi:hypothetical protein
MNYSCSPNCYCPLVCRTGEEDVEQIRPHAGDLYFMPLGLNEMHQHRVLAADADDSATPARTRILFVFFFDAPRSVKE